MLTPKYREHSNFMSERLEKILGGSLYTEYLTKSKKLSNVMATAVVETNLAILEMMIESICKTELENEQSEPVIVEKFIDADTPESKEEEPIAEKKISKLKRK